MSKAAIARTGAALAVLAVGVGVAAALYATRPDPGAQPEQTPGRLVRTFRAVPTSHRVAVKVYGTSRAADEWTAIAEVAGRITELDDFFEEGEVLPQDAVVARIDKVDYALAVKSAENDVAARQQQLQELKQTQANIESIIPLREQQTQFAKNDLDRVSELMKRGAATKSDFDRVSSAFIDRQTALRDLKNQLALIPTQEASLTIAVEAANLRKEQVERDLKRCEILLPFRALCVSRDVELHQQAAVGQKLGQFLALDRAEIVTIVEPRKAVALFAGFKDWGHENRSHVRIFDGVGLRVAVDAVAG